MLHRKTHSILTCVLLVCVLATPAPATAFDRLAAYTLHCWQTGGLQTHTRAVLVGQLVFATKRPRRFVAQCHDGPSGSLFPSVSQRDGPVVRIVLHVEVLLEDGGSALLAQNQCEGTSTNGYLSLRCLADEARGGAVDVGVSIEKER